MYLIQWSHCWLPSLVLLGSFSPCRRYYRTLVFVFGSFIRAKIQSAKIALCFTDIQSPCIWLAKRTDVIQKGTHSVFHHCIDNEHRFKIEFMFQGYFVFSKLLPIGCLLIQIIINRCNPFISGFRFLPPPHIGTFSYSGWSTLQDEHQYRNQNPSLIL